MRLIFIGCNVLARVAFQQAAVTKNIIDLDLIELGLHVHPDELRQTLQARIKDIQNPPYEAILLGYGLCGRSTAGLKAMHIPIIIPRAHDCITIFLGSRKRYLEEFNKAPGTYWFVQDYMERLDRVYSFLGVGANSSEELEKIHNDYIAKYGGVKADFLMESLHGWQKNYSRAIYVKTHKCDQAVYEKTAADMAMKNHWSFEKIMADPILITKLMAGNWDSDFLVVKPGETIQMIDSDDVILCKND